MRKPASILALAALLTSCASPRIDTEPVTRRAKLAPQEIKIYTSPAGGIVDWNGNVLGAAPLTIQIEPQMIFGRPVWPSNGATIQRLRARWPDGSIATETFSTQQTLPQVVGIISPNYRHNPLLDALYKDAFTKRDLTQRTGP